MNDDVSTDLVPAVRGGYGKVAGDEQLLAAWEHFCDQLKEAGRYCFQEEARTTPSERAEAFRYLGQSINLGWEFFVESNVPMYPYIMRYFWPQRKQAGDNANAKYYSCWIDGSHTYRIVGNRGTAKWFIVSVLRDGEPGSAGYDMGRPYNMVLDAEPLIGQDLQTEWDGSFEIVLSPDHHPGNWIRTTPRSRHVRVRQFFDNWHTEQSCSITVERVGGEPGTASPPPLITPEQFVEAISEMGRFVVKSTQWWPAGLLPRVDSVAQAPPPPPQTSAGSWIGRQDANPRGILGQRVRWDLDHDEALVLRFRPVEAYYWNLEMYNVWATTPDYRWRLCTLSEAEAVFEDDGSVIVVISPQDPGVPNWLDPGGWTEGAVHSRWVLAHTAPDLSDQRKCKVSELPSVLPRTARRITAEERKQQIARRANAVDRRFRV